VLEAKSPDPAAPQKAFGAARRHGDGKVERRREITARELGALLSGIDLSPATRRKR